MGMVDTHEPDQSEVEPVAKKQILVMTLPDGHFDIESFEKFLGVICEEDFEVKTRASVTAVLQSFRDNTLLLLVINGTSSTGDGVEANLLKVLSGPGSVKLPIVQVARVESEAGMYDPVVDMKALMEVADYIETARSMVRSAEL